MKKVIYSLALALVGTFAQAQVKVGANPSTIGTNSSLEVEATNGNKTVIQKDNGNVGIGTATPGNKLEISSGSANASGLRLSGLSSTTPPVSGTTATLGVNQSGDVVVINGISGSNTGTTQVMRFGVNVQTIGGNANPGVNYPIRFNQANSSGEMGTAYFGGENFINHITGATFQESVALPVGQGSINPAARTTDRINLPAGTYKISIAVQGRFTGIVDANYLGVLVNVDNTLYQFIPVTNLNEIEHTGTFATVLLEIVSPKAVDFTAWSQGYSFNIENPANGSASPKAYGSVIMIEKLL